MAFGAKKIFPIDTKPGTAVGVAIPFNAPATYLIIQLDNENDYYIKGEIMGRDLNMFYLPKHTIECLEENLGIEQF